VKQSSNIPEYLYAIMSLLPSQSKRFISKCDNDHNNDRVNDNDNDCENYYNYENGHENNHENNHESDLADNSANNNTSGYLENAHWTQYIMTEEYKKKKIRNEGNKIIEVFKRNSKNSFTTMLTDADNIKLRDIFAVWIINRQHPFTIIEDLELIEIIQYLNSTAHLVKADTIKNTIISLYNSEKKELKASFTIIISLSVFEIYSSNIVHMRIV
ncbi:22465_t:CDS:2, partial [Racocetra persica]